ncbi:MAG TPA: 16S rRNA (guanine(527)-N(7))-methyltransferase RsmG, partial [Turneriella sp.]|nr:16S rRNA (guanine(527)-N(7))-methyltransferase RsmG [Turneriella sp.]
MRGIPGVNAASVAQLCRHWAMMVESDDRTDLTRLEHERDIALKHYLDCALPLKFTTLPSPLLDIGTGAGFPGLVLKILSPQTHVILGEVRPKRTRFLQAVIDELGLKGVEVFAHRIGPQFPLEINGVVTRALESCRDTLYRVQPFLPQGGRVILLKGPRGEEEVAPAIKE